MQLVSCVAFAIIPFNVINADVHLQASRNGAMAITTEISRCAFALRQSH